MVAGMVPAVIPIRSALNEECRIKEVLFVQRTVTDTSKWAAFYSEMAQTDETELLRLLNQPINLELDARENSFVRNSYDDSPRLAQNNLCDLQDSFPTWSSVHSWMRHFMSGRE